MTNQFTTQEEWEAAYSAAAFQIEHFIETGELELGISNHETKESAIMAIAVAVATAVIKTGGEQEFQYEFPPTQYEAETFSQYVYHRDSLDPGRKPE